MPSAADILNDPNYINANAATKRAIFERRVATLPEYRNANAGTQAAIRQRFKVEDKPQAEPMSGAMAIISGMERGIKPVAEFARKFDPASYISDAATEYLFPGSKVQNERILAEQAAAAQAQRPNYFTGGKLVGEVAATAPLIALGGGGVAALGGKLATRAPGAVRTTGRVIQNVGKAMQSGGTGVRTVSKSAAARNAPMAASVGGRMALRAAGGGASGAAGAALTNQDVTSGAMFGMGLPIAGVIAKRGLGWTFDFISRRTGKVAAAEILRNIVADKASGIAEALANASAGVKANTAEFLASQGLLTPELAAATRIASASKSGKPLERAAQARAAEQNAMRAELRGGDTQTEGMGAIAAAKQQVRDSTEPQRVSELARADVGRLEILPAERQAAASSALARELEDNARRLIGASEYFGQSPAFTRGADVAEFGAAQAADDARDATAVAANLRAQGLQPLDVTGVVARLRALADDAADVAPDRANVFSSFANALERRAARFGGVIDATGLHLARREMGQFVSNTLKGSDPKSIQLGTAQLVGEAQPLIDDAIMSAGGTGWREYLDAFSQGMREVERTAFERKVSALPEARYAKVMRGGDPEFVAEHFGPGRFDINVEMMGPKLPTAQRLASGIDAQRAVAQTGLEDLATSQRLALPAGARARVEDAFSPGTANVLVRGVSRMFGGAPGVYGGGQLASEAEREIAAKLYQNTMRQLTPALARPATANRLLGVRSATDTLSSVSDRVDPAIRNILTQGARGYAFPDFDPETGAPLVGIGDDQGVPYPMYGTPPQINNARPRR